MVDLLWIDLETTGLDENACDILEVAVSRAPLDDPFNAVRLYDSVVYFPESRYCDIPEADRGFIIDCHTKNGLLAECASLKAPEIYLIESQLLQLIAEPKSRDELYVLAGSSVHFDHDFLRVHMPKLNRMLSHRHYDVSSVKLFCQSQGMPRFRKSEAHRARPDIEESILHLKECKQWLKENL